MMESVALVDTNVISYIFRGDTRGSEYRSILDRFDHCLISFQTLAELEFWAIRNEWGRRRKADLAYLLETYDVVHSDEKVCARWAEIRAIRRRIGKPIHPEDAWIAAVALEIGCPLVTHDVGDFTDVPDLKILTASTVA